MYSEQHRLFHDHFSAMGTRFDMVFVAVEEKQGVAAAELVRKTVTSLEGMLSCHDREAEVFRLNASAVHEPVNVTPGLWDAILHALACHRKTNGLFDFCLKPATDFLKEDRTEVRGGSGLQAGVDRLVLNEQDRTVYFDAPLGLFDFGGFGKGYALEAVKGELEKMAVEHAFISFGESSVLAGGRHPRGDCWKAGIRHRDREEDIVYNFDLRNEALSTSGSLAGGPGGQGRGHIYHPLLRVPATAGSTVSIVSEHPLDAEILSTALMLANSKEINEMSEVFRGVRGVRINYGEHAHECIPFEW